MAVCLNLADWIERRKDDVGPYASHIIHSVRAHEAEIAALRIMAFEDKSKHVSGCRCIQCVPF